MATILLADLYEESAYYLRAMCRGRKHETVVATRQSDALEAIALGNFDAVFVDLTTPGPDNLAILEAAEDIGLPTAVVMNERTADELGQRDLAAVILRPLKGAEIKQALKQIERQVELILNNRRADERVATELSVSLTIGSQEIACRSLNLSVGGAAVIPLIEQRAFEEFETVLRQQQVKGVLKLMADKAAPSARADADQEVEVRAKVRAIRRHREGRVLHLAFDAADEAARETIGAYLGTGQQAPVPSIELAQPAAQAA